MTEAVGIIRTEPGDEAPPHILTGLVILMQCSDAETRLVMDPVGDD